MTNHKFNVYHSNPHDPKIFYEIGKDMKFDVQQKKQRRKRDKSMMKLLISPAIKASGTSTKFYHLILTNYAIG